MGNKFHEPTAGCLFLDPILEDKLNDPKAEFSEQDYDQQTASEMDAVASMMKIAMQEQLETEVIYWYGSYRAEGYGVIDACYHALGEWIK